MINYEQEVKKKRPYACYVYFPASRPHQHHIRLYTGDYPTSLGTSDIDEQSAWQSAYEQLKKEGKI